MVIWLLNELGNQLFELYGCGVLFALFPLTVGFSLSKGDKLTFEIVDYGLSQFPFVKVLVSLLQMVVMLHLQLPQ